jgi:hypothetical protein
MGMMVTRECLNLLQQEKKSYFNTKTKEQPQMGV